MCQTDVERKMQHLIEVLNTAARVYYADDDEPTLSDAEYDKILAELVQLEIATGIILPESPTTKVGFAESVGDTIKHHTPILSLKSTKSVDEMLDFLGKQEGVLSWKLDGVSIMLYYSGGILRQAVSRGDGHYGKDITKNVVLMRRVPRLIPNKNTLIVRGEGCLSFKEFNQLREIPEGERYSNPRNLASGLINRTKTTSPLLKRMSFIAHSVILLEDDVKKFHWRSEQLSYLEKIGFNVVPHSKELNFELAIDIEQYTKKISDFEYPVDGLVLTLNDLEHSKSLGSTAKWPRDSLAFKWPDEIKQSKVTGMDWSVSNTGLITPIVIFEPIELEGTVVKRANLHSLKIFEELKIGVGDILSIYKANKIIPKVEANLTQSQTEVYPRKCPICGAVTVVSETDKTRKLYCHPCGNKK